MKFDVLIRRVESLECASGPDEDWVDFRLALARALEEFPAARQHLAGKLFDDRSVRSWSGLKVFILDCLQPFPGARESVFAALNEVEKNEKQH